MEAWRVRVVAERVQLNERTNRLVEFLASDQAAELNHSEHGLLVAQMYAMRCYLNILDHRISTWEP